MRVGVEHTLYQLHNIVGLCFQAQECLARRNKIRQDCKTLSKLHRHHINLPLAAPFGNLT
jgi:hypothetical protein